MMLRSIKTLVLAMLLFAAAVTADGADYRGNRRLRGMPVEAVEVSRVLHSCCFTLFRQEDPRIIVSSSIKVMQRVSASQKIASTDKLPEAEGHAS